LSRRRFDRDFNGFGGSDFNGPSGHRGPAGLIGLVFSLAALGITIAFNVLGIVIDVLSGLSGHRSVKENEPFRQNSKQQEARQEEPKKQYQTASSSSAKAEGSTNTNKEKQSTINKEQVKETFNQKKEEHTSDWNVLLFVLTLIPAIITLSMKRLDLTGLVVLAGTVIIIFYNMIRSSVIKAKKKKATIIKEEKKEETEIERVIKDAFDKVYAIRKELFRISKVEVKQKLEGLCNMAETIIGEVRENPESMNSVRKFFYYYLDAFTEVFEKYTKLSSFSASSAEVEKLLIETEKSFEDMEEIFKDLCENMLEKDMLNLKATINVIKNSNYTN
jgi:5-bromo-4-chloroindolyl phosphate hydrolysis protein/Na+-transporting methylmalonyl-CoA/oxaloacetate decarboxylase gamma subunit